MGSVSTGHAKLPEEVGGGAIGNVRVGRGRKGAQLLPARVGRSFRRLLQAENAVAGFSGGGKKFNLGRHRNFGL